MNGKVGLASLVFIAAARPMPSAGGFATGDAEDPPHPAGNVSGQLGADSPRRKVRSLRVRPLLPGMLGSTTPLTADPGTPPSPFRITIVLGLPAPLSIKTSGFLKRGLQIHASVHVGQTLATSDGLRVCGGLDWPRIKAT
jgi:hypothetical protein